MTSPNLKMNVKKAQECQYKVKIATIRSIHLSYVRITKYIYIYGRDNALHVLTLKPSLAV